MRGRGFQAAGASGRGARSPQDIRRDWLSAVELAATAGADAVAIGEGAQAAPSGQLGQVLSRLLVSLRDLAPANFPPQGQAARIVAACFLAAARGFTEPVGNGSAERTAIAPFLIVMAAQVEAQLDALRREESGAWRRATGERED